MLPPINPCVLSALVYMAILQIISGRLKFDKNLSVGVLLLLQKYRRFLAQPHQDKVKGANSCLIRFRVCMHWRRQ